MHERLSFLALAGLIFLLQGCAAIQEARMALPEGLAGATQQVEVTGLGHGQRGQALVQTRRLEFERSASRLSLFGDALVADRAALGYTLAGEGAAAATQATCRLKRRELNAGILSLPAKSLTLNCQLGAGSHLSVWDDGGLGTLQQQRRGELQARGRSLAVRSVHHVQGSPLPLAEPIGYAIEDGGRALAAVELNGGKVRLWLPPDDAVLREASLQALLALTLIWQTQ